ncbi:MAG: hypothetical protein WCK96_04305 [Methylococcales bacterium]
MSNYDDDEDKNSNYLKLSGDFDQLKHGHDGIDKAAGGIKLLGKGLFNIGKFALTEVLPKVAEESAKRRR